MARFDKDDLTPEDITRLTELARRARGDIIKMTTLAGSGHPGGSMSSIDLFLTLYSFADISPATIDRPGRDRIVISHGHTSPGVYAALGHLGYCDSDQAVLGFRKLYSPFEGHVVRTVPGIEWSTGNLGQGLAAGCGFALAARLHNLNFHTFVAMSDGEQAKGQVSEARRFAKKFLLHNLSVIIDCNRLQISGSTDEVMPVNIKDNYLADGWEVKEIDGHDFQAIYHGLKFAAANDRPTAILARTVMGQGVSFMENNPEFHGRALTFEECKRALAELGIINDLPELAEKRKLKRFKPPKTVSKLKYALETGKPLLYEQAVDIRKALGGALDSVAELNLGVRGRPPFAVFDCDLAESIRTNKFAKKYPENFFQAGVQEHSTATIAGALSTQGVITVFGDFGVFALDEAYNQQRLNDINRADLKVFATHIGLDVGPDGKTHHCIDYLGLFNNLYGFKVLVPSDPNQTDRAVRYALSERGNFVIAVGRSRVDIVLDQKGKPYFGKNYRFVYGKADLVRPGKHAAIITMGHLLPRAVAVHEMLKKAGYSIMVVNVASPKQLDKRVLSRAIRTRTVITYEDHNVDTGLGSAVAQFIAASNLPVKFSALGIKEYGASDERDALYSSQKLDAKSLMRTVRLLIRRKHRPGRSLRHS